MYYQSFPVVGHLSDTQATLVLQQKLSQHRKKFANNACLTKFLTGKIMAECWQLEVGTINAHCLKKVPRLGCLKSLFLSYRTHKSSINPNKNIWLKQKKNIRRPTKPTCTTLTTDEFVSRKPTLQQTPTKSFLSPKISYVLWTLYRQSAQGHGCFIYSLEGSVEIKVALLTEWYKAAIVRSAATVTWLLVALLYVIMYKSCVPDASLGCVGNLPDFLIVFVHILVVWLHCTGPLVHNPECITTGPIWKHSTKLQN